MCVLSPAGFERDGSRAQAFSCAEFFNVVSPFKQPRSGPRRRGGHTNRTVQGVADDSRYADVGGRYAQALFELADDAGLLAAVEADLKALTQAEHDSAELRRAMASPMISHEDKGKVLLALADAADCTPLTKKFLALLAANLRAAALPAVAKAFARLTAAKRGAVAAEVTSAIPLTATQATGVAAALRQALGKDPEITTRVDPAILGGLKVRVGSRLFDSSLKSKLDHMKFALTRAP